MMKSEQYSLKTEVGMSFASLAWHMATSLPLQKVDAKQPFSLDTSSRQFHRHYKIQAEPNAELIKSPPGAPSAPAALLLNAVQVSRRTSRRSTCPSQPPGAFLTVGCVSSSNARLQTMVKSPKPAVTMQGSKNGLQQRGPENPSEQEERLSDGRDCTLFLLVDMSVQLTQLPGAGYHGTPANCQQSRQSHNSAAPSLDVQNKKQLY